MSIDGECVKTFTTPFTAIVAFSTSVFRFWDLATYDEKDKWSTYRNTTVLSSGTAYAHPLTIYWQSTDLSRFPSSYASSLATQIGVPFPATTPAPGASTNIVQPTSNSVLTAATAKTSRKTQAGIGVGSVLGALILGAAVFTILWLRRRRHQISDSNPQETDISFGGSVVGNYAVGDLMIEVEGHQLQIPIEIDSRSVQIVTGPPVEIG